MVLTAIYSSPTTPGGAGWSEDVAGDIRLGSLDGVSTEAELGATGEGNNIVDDPDGTAGHASDGFVGLKQWALNETRCPAGNQRMWTGYTADRTYKRGDTEPSGTPSSLITTVARKIDISLVDLNWFLSFRVFAPTADDPTSDFHGLAETDLERVQRMLSTVDFLTTTLYDIGYIPSVGGVAMDATDYTGKRPIDVLNDCAQVSGRNFFVIYDEASGHFVLWYDVYSTDGSATLAFDSSIQLTNVLSEVDGTTTFSATAKGKLDPSRVISAIRGTGTGVTGYQTKPTTAYRFAWRDGDPLNPSVKDQTKLDALLLRYLNDNDTEDNRISATVRLPAAKVTAVKAGQRLPVHFTHCPGVQTGFAWTRVLQMTIRQDVQTDEFYWLDLELSPITPPPVVQSYTKTLDLGCFASTWPNPPGAGNVMISGEVTRGGNAPYTLINVPIGSTQTPNTSCSAPDDVGGTGWTFVDSIMLDVGGNTCPMSFAWRIGAVSEPQVDRWQVSNRQRGHWIEMSGLDPGGPTVIVDGVTQNGAGSVFPSDAVACPGAGWLFGLGGYMSNGPQDHLGSGDIILTPRSPALDLGLAGWTVGDAGNGYRPYSWLVPLEIPGAGTYTIYLDRTAGTPNDPGADFRWLLIFWPNA